MDYERFYQERHYIISRWVQDALLGAEKSVAEIAEKMEYATEHGLYQAANPNKEKARLHLDNFPVLLHETKNLTPLLKLSKLFKHICIPCPEISVSFEEINKATTHALKKFADYLQEVTKSLDDEKVDDDEWKKIEKEFDEIIQALYAHKEVVNRRRVNPGNPKIKVVVGK